MKKIILAGMVSLIPAISAGQNRLTLCFRSPDLKIEKFEKTAGQFCQFPLSELVDFLADDDLDLALHRASERIDENPSQKTKIWSHFLTQLRLKFWTLRHAQVSQEILGELGNKSYDLQNSSTDSNAASAISPVSANELPKGWEDLVLLKDGQVTKLSETNQDYTEHHWVAFSSAWQPVIFWGRRDQFLNRISKGTLEGWVQFKDGTCKMNLEKLSSKIGAPLTKALCTGNEIDPFLKITSTPKLPSYSSDLWVPKPVILGAGALLLAGILAQQLKDKKLVLKR